MKNKKIANVVFYQFDSEIGPMEKACIFYTDGSVENTSYEEGLDAVEIITKEENITEEKFSKMINKERIFTLSGKDLEKRFQEFIIKITPKDKKTKDEEDDELDLEMEEEFDLDDNLALKLEEETDLDNDYDFDEDVFFTDLDEDDIDFDEEDIDLDEEDIDFDEEDIDLSKEDNRKLEIEDDDYEEEVIVANESDTKKPGIIARVINKIKKSKLVRRIAIFATIFFLGTGMYSLAKKGPEGEIYQNNIETVGAEDNDDKDATEEYSDMTFDQLLTETTNITQKTRMKKISQNIINFNKTFANKYVEEGKNVKAALSWDEMVSLDVAYNSYSKEEIRIMFNGAEIESTQMTNDYKNATLQLMGAYVISTRDNPVNAQLFINSQEGKEFVEKYENLFYTCKEKTGEEQLKAVKAFYDELYKDFPIKEEIREVGISHSEPRNTLDESYKRAVTPMVAAAEMMFQNLEIDYTLANKGITYFNDLGLCNIANDEFERVEDITRVAITDKTIPLYEDFRNAQINELKSEDNYVIDDEHRDLSQLDAFKEWVNVGFEIEGGRFTGETYITTSTKTTTSTTYRTETETNMTSDREEAVKQSSEEAVKKAEEKADKEIEKENAEEKEKAEKEAEKNRQEMQEEADKESGKLEEEVKKDEEDLQEDINNANDKINNNNSDDNKENDTPVNEEDFGDHEVDFDDEHSNENGDLDESIKDITTSPENDKTNEELPDPNQTGAIFDSQAGDTTKSNNTATTTKYKEQEIIEYDEPVKETSKKKTNEEIANEIVEAMAKNPTATTEDAKVYTK